MENTTCKTSLKNISTNCRGFLVGAQVSENRWERAKVTEITSIMGFIKEGGLNICRHLFQLTILHCQG